MSATSSVPSVRRPQKKHEREDALKSREAAQEFLDHVSTRATIEVAGEFGDKRFLLSLEELLVDLPYDIVNVRMEVPSVKAARQKAPSFMTFEITSEDQSDIAPFLQKVKTLVKDAGLVLVSATKV